MKDRELPRNFANTLTVLGTEKTSTQFKGYVERAFPPKEDFFSAARDKFEKIFGSDSSERSSKAVVSREEQLGLVDSRTSKNQPQNKRDAVAQNVWGGRAETGADYLVSVSKDKANGIDATKANREIAIAGRELGALTTPVVASVNGRVDEEKLAQQIHKVAETNTEGPVTDANATTAFDAEQENPAVKEAAETTQMSEEEPLQELKLQFEGIKEKITNNDTEGMKIEDSVKVFEEYANALHNKIFDTKNADSITVMDITEYHEVTQYYEMYTGIRKQKEESETTTRTMTMQHA